MSFIMIPEELLAIDISATQFRALIHIMNNTYSSGKYAGCCCLGYQNLANLCFTNKPTIIKIIQQLEQLKFIEINRREKFNRSNAIKLTLENGLICLWNELRDSSGDTPKGYLKDTNDRYLKVTDKGYLKITEGYLKDTPYIDLKFKNLDLKNKNARDGCLKDTFEKLSGEKKIAFSGVAENRSTTNTGGQAAESSAKRVIADGVTAKAQDLYILQTIKARFTSIFEDLSLSKAGNTYILRKKGKFALIEDVRLSEVAEWLRAAGLCVQTGDYNSRLAGETLIEEAV